MTMEIKFRAWDKGLKIMFVPDSITPSGLGISDRYHTFSDVLMQYTGQPDKNGNNICVGDIWSDGRSTHHIKSLGYFYWLVFGSQMQVEFEKGEIIGNEFENPELVGE